MKLGREVCVGSGYVHFVLPPVARSVFVNHFNITRRVWACLSGVHVHLKAGRVPHSPTLLPCGF